MRIFLKKFTSFFFGVNSVFYLLCFYVVHVVFLGLAFAQSFDPDAKNKGFSELTQAGKVFQLSLQPRDKEISFQVLGHETSNVKFKEHVVEVSYGIGNERSNWRKVSIKKGGKSGVYSIPAPSSPEEDLKIQIKSSDGKVLDEFQIPQSP